jgi:hypothetical protein
MKFSTLKRFSKDIRPHIVSGAVAEINFTCLVVILNEKICGLDEFCLFGAINTTVFLKGRVLMLSWKTILAEIV